MNNTMACPYCDFKDRPSGSVINNIGDNFKMIYNAALNDVALVTDDGRFEMLYINYCPMCGRELIKKENQV